MTDEQRKYCLFLLSHFNIDGQTADKVASDGQVEIFYEIIFRPHNRIQILCSTQYGKSLFVALACICVACLQHEIIAIIAPTNEKAKIIMRYFTEHLGDHKVFERQLNKESKLDRLRMEETKERIIMRKGGGIFIISVQAGNTKKGVESAMGAGARIVIQDESCLIPDPIESTVFRMIAGKGPEAFYCKIGNPFYRNHFLTSWKDPSYHKIFIDYERALKEKRYNEEFIAEARKKPLFDVLFECKFPGEDMIDQSGYIQLIPETRIITSEKLGFNTFFERTILGIDPAGEGKDKATFVIRDRFKAEKVGELKTSNDRQLAEMALTLMDQYKVAPEDVVCGSFGVGSDIGKEIALATQGKKEIYTVLEGNKPEKEEEYNAKFFQRTGEEVVFDVHKKRIDLYLNIRALMYFRARDWILTGGRIIDDPVDNGPFKNELMVVRWKRSLHGNTIQLMSKKDMLAMGIASPNIADAFALTFLRDLKVTLQSQEELDKIAAEDDETFDPHSSL